MNAQCNAQGNVIMPDLALTDEQHEFQKLAREFAQNELAPKAYECDQKSMSPKEILKQAWEIGLVTASVPDELGGLGLSLLECCVIAEELASGCSGIYGAIEATTLAQLVLVAVGSEQQKRKYLQPLTEAPSFAGLDAQLFSSAQSKLECSRDKDVFVLNGEIVVANGASADWFLVSANGPARRIFIVSRQNKGVEAGSAVFSIGRKALDLTNVKLTKVQIDSGNTLELEQNAWQLIKDQAACVLAAGSVGIARSAMQNAIQYSKERKTFGVAISQHQAVGFMLADMAKDVEAARLLIWQACLIAGSAQTGLVSAAVARTFAQDMAMRVATDAVQVYGGYGYSKEYPVEKLMRDAKAYQVYQGTSADSRVDIGRQLVHQ